MGPSIVCPVSENEHLNGKINKIITEEFLLIHEAIVEGDRFHFRVPKDRLDNFFKVMISCQSEEYDSKSDGCPDLEQTIQSLKHTSKREIKQ